MTAIEVPEAQDADDIPARLIPLWLRIPAAKRHAALARHRVLKDYDQIQRPSLAVTQATAETIGVKQRAFYLILNSWREEGKTPLALIPQTSSRPSRLAKAKISDLRRLCKEAVEQQPFETVLTQVKMVKGQWREGRCPSDAAIRIFLDQARAKNMPTPGSIVTHPFDPKQKLDNAPATLGQVLVIDHAETTDIVVEGTPLAVTLAFDLYVGTPVGSAVHIGQPETSDVIAALEDARVRLSQIMGTAATATPMVIFASSNDAASDGLGDELESAGFCPSEHKDPQHKYGVLTQRMLGDRLNDIGLRPMRARRKATTRPDPARHTILSLESARIVIDAAIDNVLAARSTEGPTSENPIPMAGNTGKGPYEKALALTAKVQMGDNNHMPGAMIQDPPAPESGSLRSERSPELFAQHLRNLTAQAAGKHLLELYIHHPMPNRPHWEVVARVDEEKVKGTIWSRLAREAMAIFAYEGTLVQITVIV